jgi:SAM-dependent methyltransferase
MPNWLRRLFSSGDSAPVEQLDLTISAEMRRDWDERAKENARHYIVNYKTDWSDQDFYASGRETFDHYIATDLGNVCRGKDPKTMRVLEIGCGTGRITRALGEFFGEVHGVDVSSEMISQARKELASFPNLHFHENSGLDLAPVRDLRFDFAFSFLVFQHITDISVIQSYWRDVSSVLNPGALFKFQVQGDPRATSQRQGSWFGLPISVTKAAQMAEEAGLEMRHMSDAGTELFWLWLFKPVQ